MKSRTDLFSFCPSKVSSPSFSLQWKLENDIWNMNDSSFVCPKGHVQHVGCAELPGGQTILGKKAVGGDLWVLAHQHEQQSHIFHSQVVGHRLNLLVLVDGRIHDG